jgi:hypothetical protein
MFRSAGKKYLSPEKRHPTPLKLDVNGYWSDMLKRQFTFAKVMDEIFVAMFAGSSRHQKLQVFVFFGEKSQTRTFAFAFLF